MLRLLADAGCLRLLQGPWRTCSTSLLGDRRSVLCPVTPCSLTAIPHNFCFCCCCSLLLSAGQVITSSAEEHSPVKPSAVIAANVDLDSLAADDLEYNYDVAGLAGGGAVGGESWCVPRVLGFLGTARTGF